MRTNSLTSPGSSFIRIVLIAVIAIAKRVHELLHPISLTLGPGQIPMFFKSLDLTTALRPLLLPDETLLFVQDAVGLYEG